MVNFHFPLEYPWATRKVNSEILCTVILIRSVMKHHDLHSLYIGENMADVLDYFLDKVIRCTYNMFDYFT